MVPGIIVCGANKNTATTRFWKAFKSKYNTYFNGHQAYLEGLREKRDGNKDNYVMVLPLLIAGNENSKDLGKTNFATAVTKCEKTIQLHSIHTKPVFKRGHRLTPKEKQFRQRREFNPFLKNAWLLMGKAQMQTGDFVEASATFAYTAQLYEAEPDVSSTARALEAVCYAELGWYYDAEQLLDQVRRIGIPRPAARSYNLALADLHLRQRHWEEALPYLRKEIKYMPHGKVKARGFFLESQICKILGKKQEAYNALKKCLRQNPAYELKFNAQISQTEVMPNGSNKKKLTKLKRMVRNPNNINYLDQVYYAIGNLYMAIPDTTRAIASYEKGGQEAKRKTTAKGLLMLRLGDIYWHREKFADAYRCYKEAVSALDASNDRFTEIRKRSEVLKDLYPHTEMIHLQDSVQALTRMNETERNAAIDRVIAIEKERRKKEEEARKDSVYEARKSAISSSQDDNSSKSSSISKLPIRTTEQKGVWYFYDQNAVQQGASIFHKQWGNRVNEDNWRISDKQVQSASVTNSSGTVAQGVGQAGQKTGKQTGKNRQADQQQDDKQQPDSLNPLKRAYYMAQLPFTPDKLKDSQDKLRHALWMAGVIEQEQLADYRLANKTLTRLYTEFPDFKPREELLYHLFLLKLRWGTREEAEAYRRQLIAESPDNEYAKLIEDPLFEEKARHGIEMEDSLYSATYDAYLRDDISTILSNTKISEKEFPDGQNRPKFLFLKAMAEFNCGDVKEMTTALHNLATKYPDSDITPIAQSILQGIQQGRRPVGGTYSMADLWDSRRSLANDSVQAVKDDTLTADRAVPYTFILFYSPDSVNEGKLLYEVSKFNFTQFNVRNFETSTLSHKPTSQLSVKGFQSFDEAYHYATELFRDSSLRALRAPVHPVIISDQNMQLVGTKYTMEEYLLFYTRHFIPVRIRQDIQLDKKPLDFIWDEYQEVKSKESSTTPDGYDPESNDNVPLEDDKGEWY